MKVRAIRILVPPLELILRLAESRYSLFPPPLPRPSPRPLAPRRAESRYSLFRRALTSASPALLARLGSWRAVYAADSARRRVPAYRLFADEHGVTDRDISRLRLPFTDKRGYIDRYDV